MIKQPVKILGAGLKGLALSYFLKQKGISSVIYEATDRPGGWIKTDHSTGFLFEAGPRGFRPHPLSLSLIDALGLTDSLIVPDKASKKRFIYTKGKLRSTGYFAPQIVIGLLKDLLLPSYKPEEIEKLTIKEYFEGRLGKYCTQNLIDPLVSGIYAGDISKLSAKLCFPTMTVKGSIIKSIFSQPKSPLLSFKQGMQTLTDRLAQEADIRYGNTINDADYDCTPSKEGAFSSIVAINFGWNDLKLPISGFGYLVPSHEKQDILGVVFDSATFPSQNKRAQELRLTVMLGGAHAPNLVHLPDSKLLTMALQSLSKHLNINDKQFLNPDIFLLHKAINAIPQLYVGDEPKGVGVNAVIEQAYQMGNGCLQK